MGFYQKNDVTKISQKNSLEELKTVDYHYYKNTDINNPCELLIQNVSNPKNYDLPIILVREQDEFFRELVIGSSSSSRNKYTAKLSDPICQYEYDGQDYNCFKDIYIESEIALINKGVGFFTFLKKGDFNIDGYYYRIPDFRSTEYAYKIGDLLIYMSRPKYNYDYNKLRFFVGNSIDTMIETPFHDFIRYRDGGTTGFKFTFENNDYSIMIPSKLSIRSFMLNSESVYQETLSDEDVHKINDKFGLLYDVY